MGKREAKKRTGGSPWWRRNAPANTDDEHSTMPQARGNCSTQDPEVDICWSVEASYSFSERCFLSEKSNTNASICRPRPRLPLEWVEANLLERVPPHTRLRMKVHPWVPLRHIRGRNRIKPFARHLNGPSIQCPRTPSPLVDIRSFSRS